MSTHARARTHVHTRTQDNDLSGQDQMQHDQQQGQEAFFATPDNVAACSKYLLNSLSGVLCVEEEGCVCVCACLCDPQLLL